ncbi:MAG: hemerythrin domain-containing protein [Pseudomonadota bacterium]
MATAAKPRSASASASKAKAAPKEAIAILRADHKLVSELFAEVDKTKKQEKKIKLVEQICEELTIHAQVEEEIFYPAVKDALDDDELVPEAQVEHASLKMLISELEGAQGDDEMYDARVKVLSEYVKHHVKEEQNEMFPKVKETDLDLVELGAQILQRKEELKSERA